MAIGTSRELVNPVNGRVRTYDAILLSDGEQSSLQYFIDYSARRWYREFLIGELQRIRSELGSLYGLKGDEGIRLGITNRIEGISQSIQNSAVNQGLAKQTLTEYLNDIIQNDRDHPKFNKIERLINSGSLIKRRGKFFLIDGEGNSCVFDFL